MTSTRLFLNAIILLLISPGIRGLIIRPVLSSSSPPPPPLPASSQGQNEDSIRTPNASNRVPLRCSDVTEGSPVPVNSFLWVVEGRQRPSFFFGTIHVPYTRVWNSIPSNAKDAFLHSDTLHLELDLLDPATISDLERCQLLPRGKSLADVIPRALYRRLKQHLHYVRTSMPSWLTADQRGQGVYADHLFDALTENWERKRPIYVMMMLNSLNEDDIRLKGTPVLDLYLAQEAQRLKKRRGAVERVDEHCTPLNGMNLSQVLFALNRTLWQQETRRRFDHYPSSFDAPSSSSSSSSSSQYSSDDLVHHYNCGDLNQVLFSGDSAQVPDLLDPSPSSSSSSSSSSSAPTSPPAAFSSATFSPSSSIFPSLPSLSSTSSIFSHSSHALSSSSTNSSSSSSSSDTEQEIDAYFREELLYRRNEKMADRVDHLLRHNRRTSFFFAFGAGHFLGDRSVIDLLRRKGYNISHAPPGDLIDFSMNVVENTSAFIGSHDAAIVPGDEAPSGDRETRLKPRVRHDRRKPGHRNWLQGATDSAPANERNRHWLLPVTDPAPVTDSLHLKRSQFNDLWIRLDSAKFDIGGFLRHQVTSSSQRSGSFTMTTSPSLSRATSSTSSRVTVAMVLLAIIRRLSMT